MSIEVPIIILVLCIPIYFGCKWVMNYFNIASKENRKYAALIPTLLLSPLVYIAAVLIWIFSISYYPSIDFNKKEWAQNVDERFKMSEDLIENESLIGLTKEEVILLLGDDYQQGMNRIYYNLGNVPGLFNIDPDFLDVEFDDDKVSKVIQNNG